MSDLIAHDVAVDEFERMADYFDIETDIEDMTDEDRSAFEELQKKVVKAIQKGYLFVTEAGEAQLNTKCGKAITFKEFGTAEIKSADRYKDKESISRLVGILASIAGEEPRVLHKLKGRDYKLLIVLGSLFLAQ